MQKADYNFIGNVEVRDVPAGACDVAVADGWTGNIVLKTIEGLGKGFGKILRFDPIHSRSAAKHTHFCSGQSPHNKVTV